MSTTLVVVAEGTHPHKQTSRERVLPDCLIRQIKDQVQAADGMEFMWSPCEGECQLAHLLAAGEVDFAILDSGDSDIAVFQVRGFIFHPGESQLFLMSFAQLLAIFADSLLQLGDLCCSVYGCAFPLSVPCCLVMSLHVVSQLWGFPRIPAICSVADFLSCFQPFFSFC